MRLTYKFENSSGYGSTKLKNLPPDPFVDKLSYLDDAWEEQRTKLGQLEDIEDELGIDLITLFKALKNGIYGKIGSKIDHILAPHLSWYNSEIYIFKIKDYGKTWALTKGELEHD